MTKWIILAHRYLGIAISLLVIVWFASGIVMMYAGGMPRLTAESRVDRMPALDLDRVRLGPADAAARARQSAAGTERPGISRQRTGRSDATPRVQLLTVMGRPAYRVGSDTIFADTGDQLLPLTAAQARTIAAEFVRLPDTRVTHVRTLSRVDQWTLAQRRSLPLYKFAVDDPDGSELYVQESTGEVTTLTTRRSRLLAWVGTIPHWLYFAALREQQLLWYRVVVWTAGAACVVTLLGLILGVIRFRRVTPFSVSRGIPYAGGMRWHYVTGALFGVFALTWSFSGLLSMEPFEWTNARGIEVPRDAFTGGPVDLAAFAPMDPRKWQELLGGRAVKDVEFVRIHDRHYYQVRQAPLQPGGERRRERLHQPYYVAGQSDPDRVLVDAATLQVRREPFTTESIVSRFQAAVPGVSIAAADLLSDYDAYYYSRSRQTPLPVLRLTLADAAQTWLYIDPATSRTLAGIPRLARIERWLYNGLHSLDFPFWYDKRPLWDIVMLTLLGGGLLSSVLGLAMGVKRLGRLARRARRAGRPAPNWSGTPEGIGAPADAKAPSMQ